MAAAPDTGTALRAALDEIGTGHPKAGLDRADRALRDSQEAGRPQGVAAAQMVRSMAFEGLGRRDDARQAARAAIDTTERPEIGIGLINFLTRVGDLPAAQDVLGRYLDRFGYRARELDTNSVRSILGYARDSGGKPAIDALTVRLALAGYGGDNMLAHDYTALDAANILAAQGKDDDAHTLIGELTMRSVVIDALVDRSYQRLWPMIEQSAGPHLERIGRAAVIQAELVGKAPGASVEARRSLFVAYRDAKLDEQAEAVGAAFANAPDELAQLDERGGWLVNDHARFLAARGRLDEADKRFSALTTLSIEERPWLISMMLNRARMLVGHGRNEAALPLIEEATTLAQTYGSPYGRQLARLLKICALHGLGRDRDAQALAPDFIVHAADSSATFEGLICLGRQADAEAEAIRLLGNEDTAASLIGALQPPDTDLPLDIWDEMDGSLRKAPRVMAAMEKVGRVLPASLSPTRVDPLH